MCPLTPLGARARVRVQRVRVQRVRLLSPLCAWTCECASVCTASPAPCTPPTLPQPCDTASNDCLPLSVRRWHHRANDSLRGLMTRLLPRHLGATGALSGGRDADKPNTFPTRCRGGRGASPTLPRSPRGARCGGVGWRRLLGREAPGLGPALVPRGSLLPSPRGGPESQQPHLPSSCTHEPASPSHPDPPNPQALLASINAMGPAVPRAPLDGEGVRVAQEVPGPRASHCGPRCLVS